MKKTQEYHYVYKITNTIPTDSRKYYIGVHSCKNCLPSDDVKYMGSSKYLTPIIKTIGKQYFIKEILSIWKTRKQAVVEEIRLHEKLDIAVNPNYYNKSKQTSTGFDTTGTSYVCSEERKKRISIALQKSEKAKIAQMKASKRLKNLIPSKHIQTNKFAFIPIDKKDDQYCSISLGNVSVIDKNGECLSVSKAEFYDNDDLVSINKNKVMVKSKKTNTICAMSKEEFKKNDEFEFWNKNQVTVVDKRNGKRLNVSVNQFQKYDHFVAIRKGMIEVFNSKTKKKERISKEDFNENNFYYFRKKNKIQVINIFEGKPIFIDITDFDEKIYTRYFRDFRIVKTKENIFLAKKISREEVQHGNEFGFSNSILYIITEPSGKIHKTFFLKKFICEHKLPSSFKYFIGKGEISNIRKYNGQRSLNGWKINKVH